MLSAFANSGCLFNQTFHWQRNGIATAHVLQLTFGRTRTFPLALLCDESGPASGWVDCCLMEFAATGHHLHPPIQWCGDSPLPSWAHLFPPDKFRSRTIYMKKQGKRRGGNNRSCPILVTGKESWRDEMRHVMCIQINRLF
jgi:hypothetical protein